MSKATAERISQTKSAPPEVRLPYCDVVRIQNFPDHPRQFLVLDRNIPCHVAFVQGLNDLKSLHSTSIMGLPANPSSGNFYVSLDTDIIVSDHSPVLLFVNIE